MEILIDTDTPLYKVLMRRKEHYEKVKLPELWEKSEEADKDRSTSAKGARANGHFIRFETNLHDYERTCDVLMGLRGPNDIDKREVASEEARNLHLSQ